jgi:hypothetical protein
VDIDVVSKSVKRMVEHKRCVHKAAGVNESALLNDGHLLNVKQEASIEDLEGQSRFASEDQDLLIRDLVS